MPAPIRKVYGMAAKVSGYGEGDELRAGLMENSCRFT